ncbi:50S ribosomal protein L24 [Beggiatoa leptomitoformis]|uniref:Large ribosomal subunit protein uL24 n=1 Tax=Beggiatoa leptomitoformis TaxID=288004 RepID=A0A2N9YF02_9GAMM|nr:50S ribosomal protein L24 [Beggiatoa leptomitoformis]ALG68587.1 50S ribosomal protein L24 [Beggiatoa leptomitoformis]AUI69067.1 50S ribosomal protein L24 [Beggiatoa leptomitoformis]
MRKIKTGDEVEVITGKDKGKRGKVVRVMPSADRLVVENINMVKRHTRGNPYQNKPGGIVDKELSIHISNVALVNANTNKIDKVGFKFLEDGKKVRYFKSTGEVVDV